MSTKNDVLAALMAETGAISGERLARRLDISRNSVWKAIEQLRSEGYIIDAVTNRGYRLAAAPNRISEPEILKWTTSNDIGRQLEVHDRLDSTNTRAKLLAAQGAPHGYLVCADSQDSGRGRFGRSFFSPESGLVIDG